MISIRRTPYYIFGIKMFFWQYTPGLLAICLCYTYMHINVEHITVRKAAIFQISPQHELCFTPRIHTLSDKQMDIIAFHMSQMFMYLYIICIRENTQPAHFLFPL